MKANVLLDLDNTLVVSYRKFKPVYANFKEHQFSSDLFILERPYVQEFLDRLMQKYNVSIWTAATQDYARFIVENIILTKPQRRVHYVFDRRHVTQSQREYGSPKDLRLLTEVYKIPLFVNAPNVIIDDLYEVCYPQLQSCIQIKSFTGNDPDDDELLKF